MLDVDQTNRSKRGSMPLRRLALAALVAIPAAHARADALADRIGQMPAEVEETRLVGEWTEGTETGTYRIVVVRTGLQEVRARLLGRGSCRRRRRHAPQGDHRDRGGDRTRRRCRGNHHRTGRTNTLQMTVDLGGSARTAGQYLVTVEAPQGAIPSRRRRRHRSVTDDEAAARAAPRRGRHPRTGRPLPRGLPTVPGLRPGASRAGPR